MRPKTAVDVANKIVLDLLEAKYGAINHWYELEPQYTEMMDRLLSDPKFLRSAAREINDE